MSRGRPRWERPREDPFAQPYRPTEARPDAGRASPHPPRGAPPPGRRPPPRDPLPPPRPAQPPPRGPRPPPYPPRTPERPAARRSPLRRRPGRTLGRILLVLVLLLVALGVYVDASLTRVDALASYPDRVGNSAGTNWLIVGSDSRAGLSEQQRSELATGAAGGDRTDTVMLLHIPFLGGGEPALVSLPRDSAVPMPGSGQRVKLNTTYAEGGPQLLAQTVETVTGVHIDHYAEIGFAGFAGIVDDIGGVEMCLDEPLRDPLAGIDLPAGCQQLSGSQALGYVRSRATAAGDLDRVQRQREFLGALLDRATSPAVLLNPFRLVPLVAGSPEALVVDDGDHVWNLARLGWTMRGIAGGDVVTTTVPVDGFEQLDNGGSAVSWDREAALRLFEALAADEPIPPGVLPN